MLNLLRPLAAVVALGCLAPLAAQATSVTLNFNNDPVIRAAGAGVVLTTQYAAWGISFDPIATVTGYNAAGLPASVPAPPDATPDPRDSGFIGGDSYTILFSSTLHFDLLNLSVVGFGGGSQSIDAFDANFNLIGSAQLPLPGTAGRQWTSLQVAAGGSDVAEIVVNGVAFVDNLSMGCSTLITTCVLPGGTTNPAPEPATLGLVALALVGTRVARRRNA